MGRAHPNAGRRMRAIRLHLIQQARAANGGRPPPCAICGHVPRSGADHAYRVRMRDGMPVREHLYELDHVVELKDGGANELANLRLVCRKCHYKRRETPKPAGADAWGALVAELAGQA